MNPAPEIPAASGNPESLPPSESLVSPSSFLLAPPPAARQAPSASLLPAPAAPVETQKVYELPSPSLGRKIWRRIATRQFLFVSIAVHLLFGGVATVFIVQTVTAKHKLTFTSAPPSPNRSSRATEHRVQMAQKQKSMSAPPLAKRVTTTAANAKVALPAMPAMPAMASNLTPAKMGGMGGAGFGLAAAGAPSSSSGGGGGPVPSFGFRKATGLGSFVGTFYDYKQDREGHPTKMANLDKPNDGNAEAAANILEQKEVAQFANSGFSEGAMTNYFKGPDPLFSTQIYIPSISADKGPEAFNLADKVRPRRWIVIYRANVTVPESGRYRFVGKADDSLIVRFNHRIVLDGCIQLPTGRKPTKTYKMEGIHGPTEEVAAGDMFEASTGEHYDLEVLIGELPGGVFSVFLQLEKDGVDYAKDAAGCPILPLFKLAPSEIASRGDNMPQLAKDTSWSIWKAEKADSTSIFSH